MKSTMKRKAKLIAYGKVYNVREKMTEENDISGEWDDYPDWYEYEMFLVGPDGEIISEWDSLTETYNGMQRLTKADAEKAVREVVTDVEAGKAEHWFSRIPEKYLKAKTGYSVSAKKKRKAGSRSGDSSLGTIR